MMLSRSIRRFAALTALFGIGLQAFWPLLAQARPADSISVPVCSVDGTHRDIDLPLGKSQHDRNGEHCKLCLLGDGKAFLNFAVQSASTPWAESHRAARPGNPLKPQSDLLCARPRAPPQAS